MAVDEDFEMEMEENQPTRPTEEEISDLEDEGLDIVSKHDYPEPLKMNGHDKGKSKAFEDVQVDNMPWVEKVGPRYSLCPAYPAN